MYRRPTLAERLSWRWLTRPRYAPPTARAIRTLTDGQAQYLRAAMGRPAALAADPDPLACRCGHSLGLHTDHPTGYGCTACLCVATRARLRPAP